MADVAAATKTSDASVSRTRVGLPRWTGVAAPFVVLVLALVIGSGLFSRGPETNAQRAAAIEATIRCPSCHDISVAQSNQTTAIAVRHLIVARVNQGQSATQIDNSLVATYGPTILLRPPDRGLTAVVWVVPVVVGGVAVVVLGYFFWRRGRGFRTAEERRRAMTRETPATRSETAQHWQLTDEAEFLRRSLDDAAREHEANDLSDDDYAVLRRRDETRLAEVESELAHLDRGETTSSSNRADGEGGPDDLETTAEKSRFRGRPWLIALATIAIVAGAVILVSHLTAPRLPGQVGSGSVDLSQDQQVRQWTNQAEVLVQQGKVDEALHLYHEVLTDQPNNPEALSEFGWLVWESGNETGDTTVEAQGRADVQKAVKVSPTFSVAHLYLGTILLQQDHNAKAAAAQYTLFLNEKPPDADVVNAVSFITTAFNEAGLPLPPGIAAIAHDTTTTSP